MRIRLSDPDDPVLTGATAWPGLSTRATIARELRVADESVVLARTRTGSALAMAVPPGERWLILDIPADEYSEFERPWIGPMVDLVFSAFLLAILSFWAACRVARPLVRLAASARSIGAIDAFNAVLAKLRRFIVDRTKMLAAISHDLRTPLTRLRLRAECVEDPVMRDKMLSDIQRMDSMISSTLAFMREESRQEPVQRLDLAVLLQTVCDSFADSGGDASYVGPLHLAVACRPLAMERAVSNIVDNAIKFGDRAAVRLSASAGAAAIEIEDDGPGIPEPERAELFKPFTRGNAARPLDAGGAGLGLAIARSIVESHGGTIALSDRLPNGLRVRISLPVAG
jgi:signal transduction histidine kinase